MLNLEEVLTATCVFVAVLPREQRLAVSSGGPRAPQVGVQVPKLQLPGGCAPVRVVRVQVRSHIYSPILCALQAQHRLVRCSGAEHALDEKAPEMPGFALWRVWERYWWQHIT